MNTSELYYDLLIHSITNFRFIILIEIFQKKSIIQVYCSKKEVWF